MSLITFRVADLRGGLLFNKGSLWVGAHWSAYNQRLCVNLVPCLTLWFTMPGGNTPTKGQA